MALKITCPHCGNPLRLEEPYPLPGTERQCSCGRTLSISYPMGLMDALRRKGGRFAEEAPTSAGPVAPPREAAAPRWESTPRAEPTAKLPRPERTAAEPRRPATALEPAWDPPTVKDRRSVSESEPTQVFRGDDAAVLDDPPSTAPPRARTVVPASAPPAKGGGPPKGKPPARPTPKGKKPARKGSWLLRFLVLGLVGTVGLVIVGIAAVYGVGWYYSRDLPTVEALAVYRPPTVTVVYDRNHQLMGEIYEKRRYVVELDQIPPVVKDAFLSAEDAGFYEHDGVDYMGILRAIGRNAAKGRKAQGASTITQQVARNFLLTSEKTYARKIKEIELAWRIEDTFDKDHILFLYLNQIYLGSGAYGVEAAARVYFGKHVQDLTLPEAALIAGLPQRPSDYSPHRHFQKAKDRQGYVLGQMVENKKITQAEADAAAAAPLEIVERTNEFLLKAPWYTEHVRRYLVDTYGSDKVLNEGLVVETSCDLALQQKAQQAVTDGVTGTDEKVGWRGPIETLDEGAIDARVAELAKKDLGMAEGSRQVGVVVSVDKKSLVVDLGDGKALVPLAWTEWAYKPDPSRNSKYRRQDDLTHAFKRGDVIKVEIENADFHKAEPFKGTEWADKGPYAAATVYQAPEVQGALYSYRLGDGGVLAMVGGVDFEATEFNRATQAERQVGSTFKPIVYAAAIESKKFTAGTIVQDAPIVFNTLKSQLWKPENFGEDYLGDITLRNALAQSRNVVTIRVLDVIGLDPVYQMARRLGITAKMDLDLSMGLGSASITMPEMARAYSAFATGGRLVEAHTIERVLDRDGKVLEQYQKPAEWKQVLDPNVAGVMNYLLQEVASSGTAAKAQKLGLHVAGKTGTTNDFHDAWFVGFTADVLTAVWVGYDQPKSLGSSSTGGYTALPIWMDYTAVAVPKSADRGFPTAPGLTWVGIDEKTGRPMQGGRSMPFLPGTVPSGIAAAAGQKTSEDLLTSEF